MILREYVVEFGTCGEAVIRSAESPEAAARPDDLGCLPTRVRLLAEVELYPDLWEKDGALRCKVVA